MAPPSLGTADPILITSAELHDILNTPPEKKNRLRLIAAGRDADAASFARCHLANSVFFNLDEIRNTASGYPVMLPTCRDFAAAMHRLGIGADDTLVVYDTVEAGIRCAPRVAWTLAHFGFGDVRVLNSFRQYVADGHPPRRLRPPAALPEDATPATYRVADPTRTMGFEELRDLVLSGGGEYQILDSRSADRFARGHIPGALNVPVACLVDAAGGKLLGWSALRAILADAGVFEDRPAILTCNTGVTAAVLWLALRVSGYGVRTRLYDGSWSEWKERAKELGLVDCCC